MQQCTASHKIAHIEPQQKISIILIANFGNKPTTLIREQRAAIESSQPVAISESNIVHVQIFGIKIDEKQKYKKRNLNAPDAALINQYHANSGNSPIDE